MVDLVCSGCGQAWNDLVERVEEGSQAMLDLAHLCEICGVATGQEAHRSLRLIIGMEVQGVGLYRYGKTIQSGFRTSDRPKVRNFIH